MISISQTNIDSTSLNQLTNKYTHTIFLGQPTNFEFKDDFELSAHYTLGYLNKKNKNREVQLGYRFSTFAPKSYVSNGQVFYLLHGGRKYFSTTYSKLFKPYFNWHYGIALVNSEDGSDNYFGLGHTLPLPIIDFGLYTEINSRFEIGFTIEGLAGIIPTAYFKLGYRFY
jgi:hypothetical protein